MKKNRKSRRQLKQNPPAQPPSIEKQILAAYKEIKRMELEEGKDHILTEFMRILVVVLLGSIGVVLIRSGWQAVTQGLGSKFISVPIIIAGVGFAIAAFEARKEYDKNYVAALFSAVVAGMALVISFLGTQS